MKKKSTFKNFLKSIDVFSKIKRKFIKKEKRGKPSKMLLNYSWLRTKEIIPKPSKDTSNSITWLVPGLVKGSGGHINIFRFVYLLEELGWTNQRILILDANFSEEDTEETVRQQITDNFFPIKSRIYLCEEELEETEFIISSLWTTAYFAKKVKNVSSFIYFVQDFEPYFYPMGSYYIFAEQTYKMDFLGITAGSWLSHKLCSEYHMETYPLSFSYDRELYKILNNKEDTFEEGNKVLFYARVNTERRGFDIGINILNLLNKKMSNLEVVLIGGDVHMFEFEFKNYQYGSIPIEELSKIYNECDAALVISLTNLSLLPLELMACGCPVVSNRGENVEWLLNDNNAVLSDFDLDEFAEKIFLLLTNKELWKKKRKAGIEFVKESSWKNEAEKMSAILKKCKEKK